MVAIVNIVLVGKLEGLDPSEIPQTKKCNAVRISLPKSTCLLFRNGAVTIVGYKSLQEVAKLPFCLECLFSAAKLVEQANGEPLRICNIVGTTDVKSRLNLAKLNELARNEHLITYTPETFPGMKITLRSSLVGIVFHSGKIVITGAKSMDDLDFAEEKIFSLVNQLK